MDDSYRSIYGYYDWTGDYRPIADLIYYILGQGYFVDLFPYTYIIQIFICSYFIYAITEKTKRIYNFDNKYEKLISLGFFCLFLNPFFLQNIYFRYDSLPMMLSIIFVCLPLYFEYKKIIVSIVCCLLTLFTYQSSIIGFSVIVCLHTLFLISKNYTQKEVALFISKNILALLGALIIFGFVSHFLIEPNHYASKNLNFIFSYSNWTNLIYENINYSLKNLTITNRLIDYILFLILSILSLLSILVILKNHKSTFIFKIAIFLGLTLVCLLGLLNTNIFLYQPRLHARTYIGFGFVNLFIYLSIAFYFFRNNIKKNEYVFLFSILSYLPVLYFIIIAQTYNALNDIKKYNQNIISYLIHDIKKVRKSESYLVAVGYTDYTKRYQVLADIYPCIRKTIISELDVNTHSYFYSFMNNFNFNFQQYPSDDLLTKANLYKQVKNKVPIVDDPFYNIYSYQGNLIVAFKNDNGVVNISDEPNRFK
ncbi:glucosyltransferase domain-containing protein [Acinetobacter sp. HY1485]|uniref:glucosyltransferase domain-containing protein n=1 Tax=Acinetobacter sp. HY1485 TaxID=2970918 RepID=UPI0022B9A1EB|nr:glucosyltransferase domain-containing protein [Acinetobacter sp. HY1485]